MFFWLINVTEIDIMIVTLALSPINIKGGGIMKYLIRNEDIKRAKGSIPNWLIAEKLGIHENSLYRLLRQELSKEKKEEILRVIEVIKRDKQF